MKGYLQLSAVRDDPEKKLSCNCKTLIACPTKCRSKCKIHLTRVEIIVIYWHKALIYPNHSTFSSPTTKTRGTRVMKALTLKSTVKTIAWVRM